MIKNQIRVLLINRSRFIEFTLLVLGVLTIYLSLILSHQGCPLSTDILWYMNVGINGLKDINIINRYFHIYLEAVFLKSAPNPLIGIQHYWAFLITGTCLLIYLSARFFSKRSGVIHGLLSVALFLSIKFIGDIAGIVFVDISAMFMVMVVITIYLNSVRQQYKSKWMIALLGLFCFLAFKTKETTLVTAILIIGFGLNNDSFCLSIFLKRILYFILGVFAGVVIYAMLNWIFLSDPLFGLRLSDYFKFGRMITTWYSNNSTTIEGIGNWYSNVLINSFYILFLLYIISGIKISNDPMVRIEQRLVWLLPICLVIFLSLIIGDQYQFPIRFVLPVIPVICLLIPQFLDFALPNSIREKIKIAALFLGGVMIVGLIRVAFRYFLPKMGWNIGKFLVVVYEPIILSIILALTFLWKNIYLKRSILIAVLIVALIASPIIANFKEIFIYRHNQRVSQEMFYPLAVFSDEILYKPDMFMYVSQKAWAVVGMSPFAKNHDEVMDLFNVYFDASSTRDNFTYTTESLNNINDIINTDYDYLLLSAAEWKNVIEDDPNNQELIDRKYQTFFEPRNLIVLLQAY